MNAGPGLEAYRPVVGDAAIAQLRHLGERLRGLRVVHVNSTRAGGGVAEILAWMVPLMRDLGLDASWEVIEGSPRFFAVTKKIHNGLQGAHVGVAAAEWEHYAAVNRRNARRLRSRLEGADVVIVHDPQPAPLLGLCPKRRGTWIWRGHIDISRPNRSVWKGLRRFLDGYDASIFSMPDFAQILPHPQYLIAPSIDPLSDKNRELAEGELAAALEGFAFDPGKPLLVQVSRFDRMKDPVGVIRAYRLVRAAVAAQLVLAGGGAADDPEGREVLAEVRAEAAADPDVHVLELPADAHVTVNALQRRATIVLQKSVREGFGLTVTEALWKGRPVVAGDTGGIRVQVANHRTGFLVHTPEGAAHRLRYLLDDPALMARMGSEGREFVRENYLLTRHLREYLTLLLVARGDGDARSIEL